MRPLSPALSAAARTLGALPDLRLELADTAPHFASVREGGAGGPLAACLAPDGAVVAAYISGSSLLALRVSDPTDSRQWTGWTAIGTGGRDQAGICLLTSGTLVRLLYQQGSGTAVCGLDSLDGGRSWGLPSALFDPGHPCFGLAADGRLDLVLLACDALGTGAARLAAWQYGNGWQGTDWPGGDLAAVSGLAACRDDDGSYAVVVATQNLAGLPYALQSCLYTPGSSPAWSALRCIQSMEVAVGLSLGFPHLTRFDGLYRLTFLRQDTGSSSGSASQHVLRSASADFVHWQAPLPDLATMPHGAVWLSHAAGRLLVSPEAVRLAPAYAPGTGYRDLTGDVLRLDLREREGQPARLVVTLDNSTAQYAGLPALKPQAQLLLSQGYAGAGSIPTHLFYLEQWTFTRAAGEQSVTLVALDALHRLERQTPDPISYSRCTVGFIAGDLAARAGLETAASVAEALQLSQLLATFQLTPGQSYLAALRRLLAGFDGTCAIDLVPGANAAFALSDRLVVAVKSAGQSIDWQYGSEPEHLRLTHTGDRANHLVVYGPQRLPAAMAEAWDGADLAVTGQERYALVIEQFAVDAGTAALIAGLALAREARLAARLELMVPPHPGLMLFDALAVNDKTIPATTCRIVGMALTLNPHQARYDLVLTAEGM